MNIETLNPGDAGYAEARATLAASPRRTMLDWGSIAQRYNALELGGILTLPSKHVKKLSNLVRVITKKGLERDEDYALTRSNKADGENQVVFIQRLSHKQL